MASGLNTAETQSNGVLATSANTGGAGTTFDVTSGSPRFSTEASAFGTQSYKFSGSASPADLLRWGPSGGPQIDQERRDSGYFMLPSLPTASSCALFQVRNGSGSIASLQMNTSGVVSFLGAGGAGDGISNLLTYTPGTWLYMTTRVKRGTTTSNGELQIEIRSLDGLTLINQYTSAARNTGTTDLQSSQYGRLTTASTATIYWDQLRYETGAGSLIAPWVEVGPPRVPSPFRRWNSGTSEYVEIVPWRWNGTTYVPLETAT